jgi:hypothetical protein
MSVWHPIASRKRTSPISASCHDRPYCGAGIICYRTRLMSAMSERGTNSKGAPESFTYGSRQPSCRLQQSASAGRYRVEPLYLSAIFRASARLIGAPVCSMTWQFEHHLTACTGTKGSSSRRIFRLYKLLLQCRVLNCPSVRRRAESSTT